MLLGVSTIDVMYSFWAALSVLPVPKESGGVFAYGNVATCSAQAFFVNASGGILMYMATLNTYFMLKIRYNIPDAVIENRYETWFHAVPIGIWLTSSITGLSLKLFGPLLLPELGCWINSYPYGCYLTNSCTRGFRVQQYNDWYVWTFSFMWLFVCVIIVILNSILIYTAIRKQERRNESYLAAKLQKKSKTNILNSSSQQVTASELPLPDFDFVDQHKCDIPDAPAFVVDGLLSSHMMADVQDNTTSSTINEKPVETKEKTSPAANDDLVVTIVNENFLSNQEKTEISPASCQQQMAHTNARRLKQSRMAAMQSSCYIVSALFSAVWTFIPWVGYKLQVDAPVRFFFAFMCNTVAPGQGILNLLIFVRLQYLHLRETKKDWGRFRCFKHCLLSSA
jgi:hypothetical protein